VTGRAVGLPEVDLAILEAMLFSTHHPLTGQRVGELLEIKSQKAIKRAVQALNEQYEEAGRTFRIEQVAGGYQMLSLPEYGEALKRLHQKEIDAKGVGFKGFIPATFARLVNERFEEKVG